MVEIKKIAVADKSQQKSNTNIPSKITIKGSEKGLRRFIKAVTAKDGSLDLSYQPKTRTNWSEKTDAELFEAVKLAVEGIEIRNKLKIPKVFDLNLVHSAKDSAQLTFSNSTVEKTFETIEIIAGFWKDLSIRHIIGLSKTRAMDLYYEKGKLTKRQLVTELNNGTFKKEDLDVMATKV